MYGIILKILGIIKIYVLNTKYYYIVYIFKILLLNKNIY